MIYSVIAPLMLIFISGAFILFWFAYRHNYYFVQRVKVDTHGMLFEMALSQLFAGIYVLEVSLIGLFFLVEDSAGKVACTPQAIIMIVALAITAVFHYVLEHTLEPLYELLPVSLEDQAADTEKRLLLDLVDDGLRVDEDPGIHDSDDVELPTSTLDSEKPDHTDGTVHSHERSTKLPDDYHQQGPTRTAANARKTMVRLNKRIAAKLARSEIHAPGREAISSRVEAAEQLGAALAEYPDELTDLSAKDREAELKVAYQDPITREPTPIIWIPQDSAGISEDMINRARKYGEHLEYSNAGALLTKANKCEITRPAPDVRPDWMLDWYL